MKTRKNIITVLTLCAALSLTACTGKETKDTTDTQTTDAASTPESSSEINDLFQQENQLFADHQDEWNKALNSEEKTGSVGENIILQDNFDMKDESMHILLTGRTLPDSLRKYADSITTLTTEIV